MQKNIMLYINKLEGFKAAIKNIHWSSKKMPEHEYMDDFEDLVSDHQDYVAEIAQGIFGKIKNNELKAVHYNIKTPQKLMKDVLKAAENFYATIQKSKKFIGLRSVMEDFMAKINQGVYMLDMAIIESIVNKKVNLVKEGFNWEDTGDAERDYLNDLLSPINHCFRSEEDRNQTWMSYKEQCGLKGEQPSFDGFLDYCGLSRKDLMGADEFYRGAKFNNMQTENKHKDMKNNNKVVRLTESKLKQMIAEAVKEVLIESDDWGIIKNQKTKEQIPSWALNYLINGDTNGLDDEEIAEIDNWMEEAQIYDVCAPKGEEYFCRYPAFGEPCGVYDCICFYR